VQIVFTLSGPNLSASNLDEVALVDALALQLNVPAAAITIVAVQVGGAAAPDAGRRRSLLASSLSITFTVRLDSAVQVRGERWD
jgi:electron transfer flavoprotein alpha/beta subunit